MKSFTSLVLYEKIYLEKLSDLFKVTQVETCRHPLECCFLGSKSDVCVCVHVCVCIHVCAYMHVCVCERDSSPHKMQAPEGIYLLYQ